MRVDKIRKKTVKSNIIDFQIEKLKIKYNNSSDLNPNYWTFIEKNDYLTKSIRILDIIYNKEQEHYLPILKDIRFYFENKIQRVSFVTAQRQLKYIELFFTFLKESNFKIYAIEDINYDLLLHYVDFLKKEQNANRKKNNFFMFLRELSEYQEVVVNDDILKNRFPSIKFENNSTPMNTYYTKNEFHGISKTIVSILEGYFLNKEFIKESDFVKNSYWFFALCSGLNKTALDNLHFNNIELLKENEKNKTYIITGLKNRSNKGLQQQTITLKKNENHLFEKCINELKIINKKMLKIGANDDFVFYYQRKNSKKQYVKYQGQVNDIINSPCYKKYSDKFNVLGVRLSTKKIRNYWSVELYDKTKSEKIVSEMLGHSNIKTTQDHYIKRKLTKEMEVQFNLFQELMYIFSKDNNTNDWVEFQKRLNIQEDNIETLITKIRDGRFDTTVGKCIKSENKNCQSYLQCFNCQHYSIVGDKDLWKVMSFREGLIKEKTDCVLYDKYYLPIINKIDSLLKTFDKEDIIKARNLLKKSKHPFWKNNIMIKTITDNFEKENNNE